MIRKLLFIYLLLLLPLRAVPPKINKTDNCLNALEEAAALGDAAAMNDLGVRYTNGEDVEKDFNKAIQLYEQAAKKGSVVAMYNLGVMYYKGQGVVQDLEKAKGRFEQAARHGSVEAIAALDEFNQYTYLI